MLDEHYVEDLVQNKHSDNVCCDYRRVIRFQVHATVDRYPHRIDTDDSSINISCVSGFRCYLLVVDELVSAMNEVVRGSAIYISFPRSIVGD